MNFEKEYHEKLVSPEQAVGLVKSGDWVDYGHFACSPTFLDPLLAKRVDELHDVKVRAATYPGIAAGDHDIRAGDGNAIGEHVVRRLSQAE